MHMWGDAAGNPQLCLNLSKMPPHLRNASRPSGLSTVVVRLSSGCIKMRGCCLRWASSSSVTPAALGCATASGVTLPSGTCRGSRVWR